MRETIDYAERLTRAALEKLPDGEWSFEDWIDDDGIDYGKPIRLFVTLRKMGGHMVVDWTGTHPQVKGAINNTLSFTKAASYTGVRSVLPPGIPNNEGVFRAIEVICPPGTVGNGVLPAACAARGLTGFRMTDCMFGALAMMLPDKVKAAGDGGNTGVSIGGYYADRKPFIYVDFTCGAWGARPWADGLDGNSHMFANMASHSVEITEAEQPLQILAYEFVPDKAGAGKYRGGVPFRRDYRFLEDEAVLQVRSDRRTHRPFGLYGGSPDSPSENYLNPDGEARAALEVHHDHAQGDVFRHVLAGAGGWGDPLERDPGAVLRDVRNELLPRRAEADYGGWSSPDGKVDAPRPPRSARRDPPRARLARGAHRAARGSAGKTREKRARDATASASTSAARSPTSSSSARTAAVHTRKVSSSVDNYARRSSTGWASCSRDRLGRRRDRGGPPRHHGRHERDPRAQGRADRADHHRGLPRRPRDPHAADAAPLRHHLDQAAAAGRALPAPRGAASASTSTARSCAARRRPDAEAPDARDEGVEAIAVCLLHSPRQPRARADDRALWSASAPGLACRLAPRCCPRSASTSAPRPRSSTPTSCRSSRPT